MEKRYPRFLFTEACKYFAGKEVLAFGDRIAARNPESFREWLKTKDYSLGFPYRIAGILCAEYPVTYVKKGRTVYLRFP